MRVAVQSSKTYLIPGTGRLPSRRLVPGIVAFRADDWAAYCAAHPWLVALIEARQLVELPFPSHETSEADAAEGD